MKDSNITEKQSLIPSNSAKYHKRKVLIQPNGTIFQIILQIATIGFPSTLVILANHLSSFVNLYFLGKSADRLHYAAYGMGYSWYSMTAYFICMGLGSAIYILVAQALGQNLPKLCGIYYQRASIILISIGIIVSFIQFGCYPVLKFAGFDEKLAYHSGMMAISHIPVLFLASHLTLIRQFLTGHQITYPMIFTQYPTLIFHIGWCYFFINYLKYQYLGAAIANIILYAIGIYGITFYMRITKTCEESFQTWTCEAFKNWGSYLQLGIPMALLQTLQFSSVGVNNLLMGSLGAVDAAVMSIFWNIESNLSAITFGLASGAGVPFGTALGAKDKKTAMRYYKIGFGFFCIVISMVLLLLLIFAKFIVQLYTNDSEVQEKAINLMWIEIIYILFFCLTQLMSMNLNFVQLQKFSTIVLFGIFYPIVIPCVWYFGTHLGYGIFAGKLIYTIGNFVAFVIYCIRFKMENLDDVILKIEQRNKTDLSKISKK